MVKYRIKPILDDNENDLLIDWAVEKLNSYNLFYEDYFGKLIINCNLISDKNLKANFIYIIRQYKKYIISCMSCCDIFRGQFNGLGDFCKGFLTGIIIQRQHRPEYKDFLLSLKLF